MHFESQPMHGGMRRSFTSPMNLNSLVENDFFMDEEGIPVHEGRPRFLQPQQSGIMLGTSPNILSRSYSGTTPSFHHIPPPVARNLSFSSLDRLNNPQPGASKALSTDLKRTKSMNIINPESFVNYSDFACFSVDSSEYGSYSVASSPASLSGNFVPRSTTNPEFSFPSSRSASNLQNMVESLSISESQGLRRIQSFPSELNNLENVSYS
jgi:hypothetical protein